MIYPRKGERERERERGRRNKQMKELFLHQMRSSLSLSLQANESFLFRGSLARSSPPFTGQTALPFSFSRFLERAERSVGGIVGFPKGRERRLIELCLLYVCLPCCIRVEEDRSLDSLLKPLPPLLFLLPVILLF